MIVNIVGLWPCWKQILRRYPGEKWSQPVGTKDGWIVGVGQGLDESILQGGGVPLSFKVHAIWLKQPVGTKKGWQLHSEVASRGINDTEIPPPYVFTPWLWQKHISYTNVSFSSFRYRCFAILFCFGYVR